MVNLNNVLKNDSRGVSLRQYYTPPVLNIYKQKPRYCVLGVWGVSDLRDTVRDTGS